jgi:hypothetical protein
MENMKIDKNKVNKIEIIKTHLLIVVEQEAPNI